MIVSKDIKPERHLYRLGALFIDIFDKIPEKRIETFNLFEKINQSETVSLNMYFLTLDWLFLLGAITITNGLIEKCF